MAGTNKIFKDLQDHTVNPPPGLYEELWKKIKKLTTHNKDLAPEILPGKLAEETRPITEEKIWSDLQAYVDPENAAPAFDFKKITEAAASIKEQPAILQKTTLLFWVYRTAAAAAITGIVFLIYTNSLKSDQQDSAINIAPNNPAADTSKTQQVTAVVTTTKDHLPVKDNHTTTASHQFKNDQVTGNNPITKNVRADILNDDFLYTLTSFNYNQANDFFADIKKDPKISMNNYSYVNISDKMTVFLKQLYAVNRRKKATLKARRLKAKLNKWKRKDEAYFDEQANKNPLDILDLSEFIFKNQAP